MVRSVKATYDDLLSGSNCVLAKEENLILLRMLDEGLKYLLDAHVYHIKRFADGAVY